MTKSYSFETKEDINSFAFARVEGVDASTRDLSQVCGRITQKKADRVVAFLEKAAEGEIPILFARHNKNLGHRRELGGRQGRYPKKAAAAVLKVVKSAIANARVKGFGENDLIVVHAAANTKMIYGRLSAKGRKMKQNFSTARIEIVLKGTPGALKKVDIKKPDPKQEVKTEAKPHVHDTKLEASDTKEKHEHSEIKHDTRSEVKHDAKSEAKQTAKVKHSESNIKQNKQLR
ncbi:MAG: uL22 family ribosomal protein [Candidatus Micrarchaeota archaeon]|nr:uL22 family ribosomal protein [Candidatus Micrarchaeota archaeon]